ncbi:MAG: BTAD domain-containing putative transcriptional regulator [Streptosporangiaceae bacterium]
MICAASLGGPKHPQPATAAHPSAPSCGSTRLAELRLQAVETRIDADIRLGRHNEAARH